MHLSLGLEDYLIHPLRTLLHYWGLLAMWKRKEKDEKIGPMHHFITQGGEGEVLFPVQGWEMTVAPLYAINHSSPFALGSAFSQCPVDSLRSSFWLA